MKNQPTAALLSWLCKAPIFTWVKNSAVKTIARSIDSSICLTLVAVACASSGQSGEVKPPISPQAAQPSAQQITDLAPCLIDFQSSDLVKRQAAAMAFINAGNCGYATVTTLLKKNDAELSRRVKDVQHQIEQRSNGMYEAVCGKHVQVLSQPLDSLALEQLAIEWEHFMAYTPAPQRQREAWQFANDMHRRSKSTDAATQKLAELDKQLAKQPEPAGVFRASILINRAEMLMTLQRNKDVLATTQDAITAGGKNGRMTPLALKIQAETQLRLNDTEHARAACNTILSGFPRSLEVHFAQQAILDSYIQERRWNDALQQVKVYLAAFPIDEDAQQAANGLLKVLMDDEHDYEHATELAEWMMSALPLERISMDVPRCFGGCNEYVFKDYNKAERGYAMLRDDFSDAIDINDIKTVIDRVKTKAGGMFPKEPAESDDGPAGALAHFLKAVRARDRKAIGELVPADLMKEFAGRIANVNDSLVPSVTFADVIVRNVEMSGNKDSALMFVDVYSSASTQPKAMFETAMVEDGKWRIRWKDIDEDLPAPDPKTEKDEWNANNSKSTSKYTEDKQEEKK